ncbi:MAG: FecR domain-containing protein [Bacteroidota bacterium]
MDKHFDDNVNYELLAAYFAGECSAEQAAEAAAWIAASDENQAVYEVLEEVWTLAAEPAELESVDTDAAWNAVKGRMGTSEVADDETAEDDAEEDNVRPLRSSPSGNRWWLQIAAVLIAAVGLAVFLLTQSGEPTDSPVIASVTRTTDTENATVTLPDGSTVDLAPHSTLVYPEKFAGATRAVELTGKGFFDIQHNPKQPFHVNVDHARVRVLGTSFMVATLGDSVAVVVKTGTVELAPVDLPAEKAVRLPAGKAGAMAKTSGEIATVDQASPNFLYWKDQRLEYQGAPVLDVLTELEAIFDVEITSENVPLTRCRLNTKFEKQSIASILTIIAETFNLEVTPNENGYALTGEGCP